MIEFERMDYFIIQKFQRTRKKLTIFSIVKYFEGEKITTHLQYNVYLFKSKQNLHALESFPLDYSCEQSYFLEGTPPPSQPFPLKPYTLNFVDTPFIHILRSICHHQHQCYPIHFNILIFLILSKMISISGLQED